MLLIALSKIDTVMCLYIENYQALGVVKCELTLTPIVSDLNPSKLIIPIVMSLALFMKVIFTTDKFWVEFQTQIVFVLKARWHALLYMYNVEWFSSNGKFSGNWNIYVLCPSLIRSCINL